MYQIKQQTKEQQNIEKELINQGYGELTAYCLSLRNYKKANKMIPYQLLQNIEQATKYLFEAIATKKKMCIVADYDVDGATSCSIMYKGLQGLGADIHYFVPNRFIHGYGLQPSVIDDMLKKYPNIEVIITVDNGIASIDGVEYANQKNIDVVVTDHHLEGDKKPNAKVIVNPNQKSCNFPSKALAGCGVAFYMIHSLYDYFLNKGIKTEFHPVSLIDYLAIGTIADVVSLDENNRYLIEMGFDRIKKNKASVGVKALMDVLNINPQKITTTNIGFGIGPVLNAAGRIEDMGKGIDLLLSNDFESARLQALELIEINKLRKDIQNEMKENALQQLDFEMGEKSQEDMFSFCVKSNDFHEGVVGILASKIKDMLYVPTIVFSELEEKENGKTVLKGSGRSIEDIHLRDAIDYVFKKTTDCVIKFGGHSMAAGLTIYADKFDEFKFYLNEYCKEVLHGVKPHQTYYVDKEIDLMEVSLSDVEELTQQIWGQNFREPLFLGFFRVQKQQVLKDAHLKMTLESYGETIEAIHFFNNVPHEHDTIKVIFKFSINEWNGKRKPQIMIEKIIE